MSTDPAERGQINVRITPGRYAELDTLKGLVYALGMCERYPTMTDVLWLGVEALQQKCKRTALLHQNAKKAIAARKGAADGGAVGQK